MANGTPDKAKRPISPLLCALAVMGGMLAVAPVVASPAGRSAGDLIAAASGLAILATACVALFLSGRRLGWNVGERQAEPPVALLDPLTRLPNRAAFHSHLDDCLAPAEGTPEEIAVVYADLDHFKEVNDGLGHSAGDTLLEEVSTRFRAALARDDMLARIGGDEFALVLRGAKALQRAEEAADRMIESVRQPFVIKGDNIAIGVSLGISSGHVGEFTGEELIRRADVALYRAKAEARMCFRRFDPVMDEASSHKRAMRNDLELALAENQLRIVLQPVFDARTGKLASAEALMRWSHPDRGDVSPARFIPLAEEAGLIFEITAFALRNALDFARELATIPVAVNISPLQFRSRNFPRLVADNLLEAGIAPDLLKIEITEGVLISHTDQARTTLRQLREIGVQVVLDDFGTGYSSLNYLQNFAFDAMKIDRSFLRHLGAKSQSTQLMRAIIDLGHSLDMKVVAEGIENAWQTSVLQLLGCDYLQGFYLGLPGDLAALQSNLGIDIQAIQSPVPDFLPKSSLA